MAATVIVSDFESKSRLMVNSRAMVRPEGTAPFMIRAVFPGIRHTPPLALTIGPSLRQITSSYDVVHQAQRKYERLKPTRHSDQPP